MIGCTDHDELARAFDQMIAASFHLHDQCSPTHFTLYIPHGPAHNSTLLRRLGTEKVVKESRVAMRESLRAKLELLHVASVAATCLMKDYQPSSVMMCSSATPISRKLSRTASTMPPGPQM